jgi:hypothetical protein
MTPLTRQQRQERRSAIGCGLKPRRKVRQQLRLLLRRYSPRIDWHGPSGLGRR